MSDGSEHEGREWPTRLARIAVILGLLSIALSLAGLAVTVNRAITAQPEWHVYEAWTVTALLGAVSMALLAIGLSVAVQVGRWRRSLPPRLGCLSLAIGLLALLVSAVCF